MVFRPVNCPLTPKNVLCFIFKAPSITCLTNSSQQGHDTHEVNHGSFYELTQTNFSKMPIAVSCLLLRHSVTLMHQPVSKVRRNSSCLQYHFRCPMTDTIALIQRNSRLDRTSDQIDMFPAYLFTEWCLE